MSTRRASSSAGQSVDSGAGAFNFAGTTAPVLWVQKTERGICFLSVHIRPGLSQGLQRKGRRSAVGDLEQASSAKLRKGPDS